jgi:hypothetical protein
LEIAKPNLITDQKREIRNVKRELRNNKNENNIIRFKETPRTSEKKRKMCRYEV